MTETTTKRRGTAREAAPETPPQPPEPEQEPAPVITCAAPSAPQEAAQAHTHWGDAGADVMRDHPEWAYLAEPWTLPDTFRAYAASSRAFDSAIAQNTAAWHREMDGLERWDASAWQYCTTAVRDPDLSGLLESQLRAFMAAAEPVEAVVDGG